MSFRREDLRVQALLTQLVNASDLPDVLPVRDLGYQQPEQDDEDRNH